MNPATATEKTFARSGWQRGAALVAARLSLGLELAEKVLSRLRTQSRSKVHDKTGLVADDGKAIALRWNDPECAFPQYDSLAHSLWRAQEVTLFRNFFLSAPPAPTADYGCGDGSFAQMVVKGIDYGIDYDPAALQSAATRGVYRHLVNSTAETIPLPDASVGSIFANSVVEHVDHPLDSIREMARVLRPGGQLALTMPLVDFEHQVAAWFGRTEARRVQERYWHRNLWTEELWREVIVQAGFDLLEVRRFQPPWFTYHYRMLRLAGRRAFGRIMPSLPERIWRRHGQFYVEMVRESLRNPADGCNLYVVARKN